MTRPNQPISPVGSMTVATRALVTLGLLISLVLSIGCESMKASQTFSNAIGFGGIPPVDLEEQYINEDSEFLEIRGMRIHYRDVGEGPVIILVHGIFSSLHTWDGWVEELRKSNRVITLDLPGFGLTGGPEDIEQFDVEFVYAVFKNFIQYMDAEHFTLAGNSFGGYLSARYAIDHPDKVDRLILIDPSGYSHGDRPLVFKMASTPVVSSIMKVFQPPFMITRNVKRNYGDPEKLTKENLYRYVHMAQRQGAKPLYVKTLQMLGEDKAKTTDMSFSGVKAPTLLMWGEADAWTPLKLSERWMADLRNVKLITYPDVGHMPMEEIPFQTVSDAITFLADAPGAGDAEEDTFRSIKKTTGEDLESLINDSNEFQELSEEEVKRMEQDLK
ncbi:alpha/beta fold hydrolase [Allohahella sp. A8]|uniref:alpha/beta fold hydrolase n=1 Tax=Allohahella sp. A8 TaxID=3141461 RepID=UPI003A7FFA45